MVEATNPTSVYNQTMLSWTNYSICMTRTIYS